MKIRTSLLVEVGACYYTSDKKTVQKKEGTMFTLHHGFWIYFFTRKQAKVWQYVLGSMLPDYVYVGLIVALLYNRQIQWNELTDIDPTMMMSLLPLYPWVVKIDLFFHSVVIWGIGLALTFLPVLRYAQAFVIGWGTHILIDSLTHAAHANFYLYPLSMAAVHSPVSYWEMQYFSREFKWVNYGLMSLVALYLIYQWWKTKRK